jgi:hypothetical protein
MAQRCSAGGSQESFCEGKAAVPFNTLLLAFNTLLGKATVLTVSTCHMCVYTVLWSLVSLCTASTMLYAWHMPACLTYSVCSQVLTPKFERWSIYYSWGTERSCVPGSYWLVRVTRDSHATDLNE